MSLTCQVCGTAHQKEVPFCRECGYPLKGEGLALEGRCIGNYRLVERIGGGGFGEVYRAEHIELGKLFAVKILHARLSSDEQFVINFRREAMVLAGLEHENVVQVVDFGEHPEIGFYLVMEWLEGRTLHRVWRRKRAFPIGQIYALFSQLLDALQLAHSRGIVHRDMKPDNLFLIKGSRGRSILKIVDFGIATIINERQNENNPLNQTGMAVGTPYYMSPEQAGGDPSLIDHRSDIYACGVILVELLTGRRMFKSKDPKTILRHQRETPIPRLKDLYTKLTYSDAIQGIVDRALAKDKEDRFSSAAEFFEAFDQVMKAEGVQADEEGLDASSTNTSKTNLFALVGVSSDEHDSSSGVSTPSDQGQKSGSQNIPINPQDEQEQRVSPLALWGGIAFGFLLTIILGLVFVWGPFSSLLKKEPEKRVMHSLPPLKTKGGKAPPRIPTGQRPQVLVDAGSTPTAPEPTTSDAGQPEQIPEPESHVIKRKKPKVRRRRHRRRRRRRRKRSRQKTKKLVRKKTNKRRVANNMKVLRISSKPGKAKVYLDGKFIGNTPLKKQVKGGQTYMLQVKKSGYITPKPYSWRASRNLTKTWSLIEDL